jgi:hypothetical protein
MCKDAVNRDSTCQSIFRRLCTAKKIEDFRFPVSLPDNVLSCPDAHLSTIPSVWTTCHPVRTPDRPASSVRTTYLSVRTLHCIKKLLFQLASVRTSHQPVQTSISDRSASDSLQVQNMGRFIHCPDDVVSRPDTLINKARISIQISLSGRQSALVRTRAHQIRLQPSGRTHSRYGNCVLKNFRPDVHPLGPDARSLIWKLLAADVRPSDRGS